MSERKTKEQLEKIKKKFGVDILWSWSRYNCFKNDSYGYLLRYILKTPPDRHNTRYGTSGGAAHDIAQNFYEGKIKYEDMIEECREKIFEMDLGELKYNRKDEAKNKKIADKYEENLELFFMNHIPIKSKCITEQFVTINVNGNIFQGYIDFVTKSEDGCYTILDWKTSTIYTGQKILKERGQLLLYAESLHQLGVPLEKIKICWNFLKYCTVNFTTITIDKETKLNKEKARNCLRNEWVNKIHKDVIKWLKKMEYDEVEIQLLIEEAIENNNLDNMPKEIQEKFSVSDCYVYIPFTQEDIDELKEDIVNTIKEIEEKTEEYNRTKNDELFWVEIDSKNEYFFHNLSDYGKNSHRPYREYLEMLDMFMKDEYKDMDGADLVEEDWMKDL